MSTLTPDLCVLQHSQRVDNRYHTFHYQAEPATVSDAAPSGGIMPSQEAYHQAHME